MLEVLVAGTIALGRPQDCDVGFAFFPQCNGCVRLSSSFARESIYAETVTCRAQI